ncbi:DNA-binding transcriptional regulator [Ruegeria sp. HKCCA6837]|uniref:helix-turn-helix domain-containing protein n=1 Tax=Ruegeria sp. HKCCA6837 TaxID=2682989 RepID=UPI0014879408|nr:hypothetical protein [Ruegeria sp. HKCCA6837]
MTNSSLKALAAQLGPVKDVVRNKSGSKGSIALVSASKDPDIIQASRALAKCGVSLLKAKRAVEQVAATGTTALILLPKISDLQELLAELKQAGIKAISTTPDKGVNLPRLRKRLGYTQEQFCVAYGFEVKTFQKYEDGSRTPSGPTAKYLSMIEKDPKTMEKISLKE